MGCCCGKQKVAENVIVKNSNSNSNILDSPLTNKIQRDRDGTIKQGQIPKETLNAYAEVLNDDDFYDINESFIKNPLQINPFIDPWIEPESNIKPKPNIYEPPALIDPQAEYLLDMSTTLSIFNIKTKESSLFQGKIYSNKARAIFYPPNKVFICGGQNSRKTYILDIDSGELVLQGNLKEAREYHSLAVIDDIVLVSGGMSYEELNTCEIFFRGQWSVTGPMLNSRSFHSSITIDKCVYVCGGLRQSSIEKWNGGQWSLIPVKLPVSLSRCGICPLSAHSFIVIGGESNQEYSVQSWEVNFYKLTLKPLQSLPMVAFFNSSGTYDQGKAIFYLAGQVFRYSVNSNNWIS